MGYAGSERRVHRVYVTRNTEYHVRKERVVAVRDRRSGQWLRAHAATGHEVRGGLRFHLSGAITPNTGNPIIGDSILFHSAGKDLITSAVIAVERPARDVVLAYPS